MPFASILSTILYIELDLVQLYSLIVFIQSLSVFILVVLSLQCTYDESPSVSIMGGLPDNSCFLCIYTYSLFLLFIPVVFDKSIGFY